MKTFCDSIACAVIRQPSISRCGTRSMISRSLNVPGSDSSALTTRYVGLRVLAGMKLALRPVGKNAPPRPRRFEASSSSIDRLRLHRARPLELRVAADRAVLVELRQVALVGAGEDDRWHRRQRTRPRSSSTIAGTSSGFTGSR